MTALEVITISSTKNNAYDDLILEELREAEDYAKQPDAIWYSWDDVIAAMREKINSHSLDTK